MCKNTNTGKEVLINPENRNEVHNLEKIIDSETGKPIIVNQTTGEKIENIIPIINPETVISSKIHYR